MRPAPPLRRSACLALGVLCACVLLGGRAAAQTLQLPEDPAEIEAFFDGLLPGLMEAYHVPGATLSVVRRGGIVLEKGYGYADVEARRPVDPKTSLFRLASISKLVTATAILQLAEDSRIDLEWDVNRYLERFQIEEAFGGPVSLHHLLTHTAGFDDRFLESTVRLGEPHPTLADYLAERMPPRVMPAGEVISYSNHGLALVGHLVEQVSGQPFEAYVQEHVFDPLGMRNSHFGIPVPVPAEMAVAHRFEGGRYRDIGYDYTMLGPAAELVSTAHDMAKFMIAHLQMGQLDGARILEGDAARRMQARQFSHDPRMPGWCYGFQEGELEGLRTIGHGGSWKGFQSSLILFPDAGVGIFVSLNSDLEGPFWQAYLAALGKFAVQVAEAPKLEPPADFASRADRYAGDYVPSRRMRGSLLKTALFLTASRVSATPEGTLVLSGSFGPPIHFVELEPDWFRELDGRRHARFLTDADGRVTRLAMGGFALDRIPAWQSPRLHGLLGILGLALFVATLLGWAWGALSRRFFGGAASSLSRAARAVAAIVCALYAVSVVGILTSLDSRIFFDLVVEVPPRIEGLLVALMGAAVATLALPWLVLRGFREGAPFAARLHYGLVTAFAFGFLWLAWYWNLLGFQYGAAAGTG